MGWVQCILLLEDAQQNPLTTEWLQAAMIADFRNVNRKEGSPPVSPAAVLGVSSKAAPTKPVEKNLRPLPAEQLSGIMGRGS